MGCGPAHLVPRVSDGRSLALGEVSSKLKQLRSNTRAIAQNRLSVRRDLPAFFEFGEDQLGDFFEGFEDAGALNRYGFQHRFAFLAKLLR